MTWFCGRKLSYSSGDGEVRAAALHMIIPRHLTSAHDGMKAKAWGASARRCPMSWSGSRRCVQWAGGVSWGALCGLSSNVGGVGGSGGGSGDVGGGAGDVLALGAAERLFLAMDATTTGAPRATFAITMQYSGGCGAPRLTHDAVVAAVAAVMAAAPLLTCTAAGRVEVPGDARFVATGTPLPVAAAGVTREARGDWREVAVSECRAAFAPGDLLWRVRLVLGAPADDGGPPELSGAAAAAPPALQALVLVFHHTLTDGRGAARVATLLAAELAGGRAPATAVPLVAAADAAGLNVRARVFDVVAAVVAAVFPRFYAACGNAVVRQAAWVRPLPAGSARPFLMLYDSLADAGPLAAACRAHKTTVTAAVIAAVHIASATMEFAAAGARQACGGCGGGGSVVSRVTVPVDVRPRLVPPVDRLALRVYAVTPMLVAAIRPTDSLWPLAVRARRQLASVIPAAARFFGLLSFIKGPWTAALDKGDAQALAAGPRLSVCVSNLGVVSGAPLPGVASVHFATMECGADNCITLGVSSTWVPAAGGGGAPCLRTDFALSANAAVPRAHAEAYLACVLRCLGDAAGGREVTAASVRQHGATAATAV